MGNSVIHRFSIATFEYRGVDPEMIRPYSAKDLVNLSTGLVPYSVSFLADPFVAPFRRPLEGSLLQAL